MARALQETKAWKVFFSIWIILTLALLIGTGFGSLIEPLSFGQNVVLEVDSYRSDRKIDTDSISSDEVVFSSDVLEERIRGLLGHRWSPVREDDLYPIVELELIGHGETLALDDLQYFPNLEELRLSWFNLKQTEALADLPLLILDVSDSQIEGAEHLSEIRTLEELNISNTNIRDVSFIADMTSLTSLRALGYRSLEAAELETLPDFKTIYVSRHFKRSELAFMIGNFYDADQISKLYFVGEKNNLDY